MKPTIRRANVYDALYFARHLRPADARELQAAHPQSRLVDILIRALRDSEAYVASFHTDCVLFGVAPVEPGIGTIWMVCTDGIKGHAISILREARHWIAYWKTQYSLLANYVEDRNLLHLEWLWLLGAKFDRSEYRNGILVNLFYL